MGHLILDLLRRGRLLPYVVLALALPNFPPVDMSGVTALVTALMIGNWYFSRPGTSREILQLPLSRKQLWRIRWILAFGVPLLILFGRLALLGIAAVRGREEAFRLSWALLIFLFQWSTLGILAVMSGPIRQRVSNRSKLLDPLKRFHDCFFFGVYSTVYVIVVLTAIGAAVALETPAYRQMAEWPAGAPLLLAAGLCVAAISFFHSPQIAPRSVVYLSPSESKGGNKTRRLTKSRMTGPAFFVWTQIRTVVLKAMISGSVFLFLWWILDGLLLKWFTMFSAGPHVMASILLWGMSLGGSSTDFLETRLRHLRVLPRSTRTLAAVLTLLPVLSCLCHWVFPVAAYLIISGHLPWPWALRLEWLSVLAGVSSLLDSVALRAVGTSVRFLPGLFLFMAAGFAFKRFGTPWPPEATGLIGLLGLTGIAASFVLNARALRRSSSIYKSVFRLTTFSQPRWISE